MNYEWRRQLLPELYLWLALLLSLKDVKGLSSSPSVPTSSWLGHNKQKDKLVPTWIFSGVTEHSLGQVRLPLFSRSLRDTDSSARYKTNLKEKPCFDRESSSLISFILSHFIP